MSFTKFNLCVLIDVRKLSGISVLVAFMINACTDTDIFNVHLFILPLMPTIFLLNVTAPNCTSVKDGCTLFPVGNVLLYDRLHFILLEHFYITGLARLIRTLLIRSST